MSSKISFFFPTSRSTERMPILGVLLSISVFVALAYWTVNTQIKIFITGYGTVIPVGDLAVVQHENGGVVRSIFVEEGQLVSAGDVMLTLDENEIQKLIALARVKETQLSEQMEYFMDDLRRTKELYDKGLVPIFRLNEQERVVRDAVGALREAQTQGAALKNELKRLSITAPESGYVQGLQVKRSNEIIGALSPILTIVPIDADLELVVEVAATEIGPLDVGDKAFVRVLGFDYVVFGEIDAAVKMISSFTRLDQNGLSVYDVTVELDPVSLATFEEKARLMPGMSVEVQFTTDEVSLAKQLLKPILKSADSVLGER